MQIFVGRPSQLTADQQAHWQRWADALANHGLEADYLTPDRYTADPWDDLRRRITAAAGVLVLGVRQLSVGTGVWRPGTPEEQPLAAAYLTSAWMNVEAGLAAMSGRPTLVVAEAGVVEGAFDPRTWTGSVRGAALDAPDVDGVVREFVADIMKAFD